MQYTQAIQLVETIANAKKLQVSLNYFFATLPLVDEKSDLVFRYFSIGRQHHDTIVFLIDQEKNPSSAAALLRPLIDALYRGIWIAQCASPDQIKQFVEMKLDLSSVNFAKEVANLYDGTGLSKENRDVYHGFTHGGYEQLGRQLSSNGFIEPEFDLPFLIKAVQGSSIALALLAIQACDTVGNVEAANAIWDAFSEYFSQSETTRGTNSEK